DLRGGDADLGIIPSIEYQRMDGVVALPGMAIAAKNEVRSLLVVAKKPIEMARRIALDTSSRSTAALVRLRSAELWHSKGHSDGHGKGHAKGDAKVTPPEFVDAAPD